MAKASVVEIFRAFLSAQNKTSHTGDRISEMQSEGKSSSEIADEVEEATDAFTSLCIILQDCEIEIEIPPESEGVVRRWIKFTSPIGGSD